MAASHEHATGEGEEAGTPLVMRGTLVRQFDHAHEQVTDLMAGGWPPSMGEHRRASEAMQAMAARAAQ